MQDFIVQWILAAVFGLAFGYIVSTIKHKAKVNRDMIDCNSKRLDTVEKAIFLLMGKEIKNIYNKYKSKDKIPDEEMELADAMYEVYAEFDNNGIMKKRIEAMRAKATSQSD